MKIFTIVGARPNFIKIDPELKQSIIHTGQHYDEAMSDSFFKDLNLPAPMVNLGCKSGEFGKMVDKLRDLFQKEKPDLVVVFGDTISSLAGALAAAFTNVKIVHIEAGLRSYKMDMPEETARVLIDRLATVRICPNLNAEQNLAKEGIKDGVYVLGDPEFDTMGRFLPIEKSKDYEQYSLLTVHRDFNADNEERLKSIFAAIAQSGEKFIFPVHPRTLRNLRKFKIKLSKNVKKTTPKQYGEMLKLISNAKKVVTDSGGVQREAYWMNRPVIILRAETEWMEIVNNGAGILVDAKEGAILNAIQNFHGAINPPPEPFVNKRIRDTIYKYV